MRYEFCVLTTAGDGSKKQERRRFATKKAADDEYAKIKHQSREGTHVRRWDGTIGDVIDAYLTMAGFEAAANTRANYALALKPARDIYGSRAARSITQADAERLRDHMLTAGRKRGGVPGTALSARSVRLTLGRWSAAMEQAVDDGKIPVNHVRKVKLPKPDTAERRTWTRDQVQRT